MSKIRLTLILDAPIAKKVVHYFKVMFSYYFRNDKSAATNKN